jgi:hypothetical protein
MRLQAPPTWLIVAAALLLPGAASAQQTYRITLKQPAKDETALYRKLSRHRVSLTTTDSKTREDEPRSREQTQDIVYLEEVLAKPDGAGKGRKVRRRYRWGEQTLNEEKRILPYVGKPLLIEEVGGRYRFRIEDDKELQGVTAWMDANGLDWAFNSEFSPLPRLGAPWLLPKTAVKLGESWKFDPGPFVEDLVKFSSKLEFGRSAGTGKLLRTYRSDGRQHGVLDLRIEVPIKAFAFNLKPVMKPQGNKLVFHMVVDACIDGSSYTYRLKGSMVWEVDAAQAAPASNRRLRGLVRTDYFESRQEPGKE